MEIPSAVGRGIFVEIGIIKFSSSVGAAYSDDVAPTELDSFALLVLQRFQSYGLRRLRNLRAINSNALCPRSSTPNCLWPGLCRRPVFADSHHAHGHVIFAGDEVTSLSLKTWGGIFETPHVVAYGFGMGERDGRWPFSAARRKPVNRLICPTRFRSRRPKPHARTRLLIPTLPRATAAPVPSGPRWAV